MNCDGTPFLSPHCGGALCSRKVAGGNTEVSIKPGSSTIMLGQRVMGTEAAGSLPCFSAQAGFPDVGAELVGAFFCRGNPSPNPFGLCTA